MNAKNLSCKALFPFGLVAAVAVAAAASDVTPQAHSDSVGAAISDTVITAKVKSHLMGDELSKSNISVTTTNGVVTLSGTASSTKAKSYAEQQAQSVDGVKSVDDELATPAASSMGAKAEKTTARTKRAVSDSWITTKVKSEILADSISKGFDVSVTTKHGVVVLSGTLANDDAVAHVKDLAEKVHGVKSVDTTNLKSSS